MIVETSALIAMVFDEARGEECRNALVLDDQRSMSAASYFEASIVTDARRDPVVMRKLDAWRQRAGIHLVPFTATQAELARQAYRDFGRGSGNPAKLNMGDCYAYALASDLDEPLLFIGNDFIHTDIRSVLDDPRP
ncbi:MAG: type II toxin-antitoxin system VapC family toxin [Thermoleophilia bacterium]|nr:type II toxin-antitoxin system VapC family toxin [Thermoleophilia bacterium]